MKKAETAAGILLLLPDLLMELRRHKSTKGAYQRVENGLIDENQRIGEEKRKAFEWIQQMLKAFKDSPHALPPRMVNLIRTCEQILSGELIEFSTQGLPLLLQSYLREIVLLLASFGESPIFQGWAVYASRMEMISLDQNTLLPPFESSFLSPKELATWKEKQEEPRREISRSSEEGERLIEVLGSGYVRAYQLVQSPYAETERLLLERGIIESFSWPQCFQALRKRINFEQWQLSCDVSVETLLSFLAQLALFERVGRVDFVKKYRRAQTLIEMDEICNQWFLDNYLRAFSPSVSSVPPIPKQELVDLVEKFLLHFVKAQHAAQSPQKKSENANDVFSYACEQMKEILQPLSPEDRRGYTKKAICDLVKRKAPHRLKKTLTPTLLNKATKKVRNELKELGEPWPVAVRGKDRGERRSA